MEENFSTTFWSDFSIADAFGINAIKDTYKRAFKEWKKHYQYLTDLVIVLNHKCWYWYEHGNEEYSRLYEKYYYEAHEYALEHLKGEEFEYYFRKTD